MIMSFVRNLQSFFFIVLWVGSASAETLPVADVQQRAFPLTSTFDAVVEAVHQATISSRIAAEVVELNFDVNDKVPEGAVIMRFKDEEFKARLSQAEATLQAERAQYREAVARQKEATAEAKRVSDLFKRKQVTLAATDKAKADKAAADARVSVLAAQIKTREAQLEEAKVQLSYTVIKAPYGGVVTKRLIELGEMASPGQLLMSGLALQPLRAVASVPQRLINKAMAAETVLFQQANGSWTPAGAITQFPQADTATHSFDVRVALPEDIDLYPGSMIKLAFQHGSESVLVVPSSSVVKRSEVAGVYLYQQDKIIFRQIRTGREFDGQWLEILAGLSAGEQVITKPAQAVVQMKVKHHE